MNDFDVDPLVSLRDCLLQISQGKIAEKKRQIERLKTLLRRNEILVALDKNSKIKRSEEPPLNWERVFANVRSYINQEADRLYEREQGSGVPSQIVLSNRLKDKKHCSDLLKHIVKIIISRSNHGASLKIINHILAVLNNAFGLSSFGLDYTNVLLKEVLPSTAMCLEISCEVFERLITLYCKFIKNPPHGWDKGVLTQVLYQLLVAAYRQYDVDTNPLFEFFTSIFITVNFEKATTYHQFLLQSLLLVCQNVRSSCRVQMCAVGETTLLSFVHLWKSRPTESFKELILQFFQLQMVLHHPQGAIAKDSRAFACDQTAWENILVNLYYMVMWKMDDICQKNKYSSSKDYTLNPLFISVAVEVCAQVFRSSFSTIQPTQLGSTLEASSAVKRRRVEIGFGHFIGVLHQFQGSLSSSAEIIAWLQLIAAILTKYQQIVSLEEIVAVINCLMEIHLSCNQIDVKTGLLNCCQAAVEAYCTVKMEHSSSTSREVITCDWLRLWELGVKCVSLMHQCHESGHKLLRSLLRHRLVTPKYEFLNLYHSSSNNKISSSSLLTLAVYLQTFVEPPPPSVQGLKLPRNLASKDWFRNQLLDWLFQRQDDIEFDSFVSQLGTADWRTSTVELMATLICSLGFQDYKNSLKHMLPQIDLSEKGEISWIEEIEQEMLSQLFDVELLPPEMIEPSLCSTVDAGCFVHSVWEYTLQLFLGIHGKVLNNDSSLGLDAVFCMKFAYLAFCTLKTLHLCHVLSEEELLASPLVQAIKDLIYKAHGMVAREELNVHEKSNLHSILPFISAIAECPQSAMYAVINQLSFSFLPSEIFYLLTSVLSLRNSEKKGGLNSSFVQQPDAGCSVASTSNGTHSRLSVSQGFQQRRNRYDIVRNVEEDELDIGASEAENSNSSCDVQTSVSKDELSKLQLESCDVLILMSKSGYAKESLNLSSHAVVEKLLSLIPVKTMDFLKQNEVTLFLQLLKCVLSFKDLSAEDLNTVISSMKVLLNKCSKLCSVSVAIISLFEDIYPHVFKPGVQNEENKDHTIYLLNILWSKMVGNVYNKDVAFALSKTLCKLLQYDSQLRWDISEEPMDVDNSPESSAGTILLDYTTLFTSTHLWVRLFLAADIRGFCCYFKDLNVLLEWFEKTCLKYQEMITMVDSEDIERPVYKDHLYNYVNTYMHFLFHTYLHIPSCRKRVLFIMCQLGKSTKVSSEQILKVLKQIRKKIGYQTLSELIEPHVIYLLDEWIDSKYSIESFPVQLLEFENLRQFYISVYGKLVPLYINRFDVTSLETIADHLGLRVKEVVYKCLPQLLSRSFAWCSDKQCAKHGAEFLKAIRQIMSEEAISIFLVEHMDDIFISLLALLDESSDHLDTSTKGSAVRYSQGISPSILHETLNILKSKVRCEKSFIRFLCQKQDGLQNILLFLHIQLSKALNSPDEKGQAVLMCQIFVELLLPELEKGLPNYASFVITELINSLTNYVIKRNKPTSPKEVLTTSIDLMQKICVAALPLYSEVIGSLLSFIVSSLIPLASHEAIGNRVLTLLTYLVADCSSPLENYIVNLDPFPNIPCLEGLRQKHIMLMYKSGPYTLEMEMKHFIQSYERTEKATLEGLKHLNSQLKNKKGDLLNILDSMQDKTMYLEDIRLSTFHRLVRILLNLCVKSSSPTEIEIEASRCLGEIGPVDFSTMLLHTSEENIDDAKELNQQDIYHSACLNILKLLYKALKDERITLKETASRVLKDVFKTKLVQGFIKSFKYDDKNWIAYLYPFHQPKDLTKKNVPAVKVNLPQIDSTEIWIPVHDHCRWVTNLVCTILDSGVTENEMFSHLKPLCKINPNFCSEILPYLTHAMMNLPNNQDVRNILSKHVSTFFKMFSEQVSDEHVLGHTSSSVCFSKETLQTMLAVINHLRRQDIPGIPESSCTYCWTGLNLDYLRIAQAALYCSAYFTAIFYTELWCNNVRTATSAANTESDRNSLVCKILSKAYSGIGEADGVYGSIEVTASSESIIDSYYLVEKKWDKLLNFYMSENKVSGILKALKNCGLDHSLQKYLDSQSFGSPEDSSEIAEYQSECAWRLGQWDTYIPEKETSGFQEQCYKSLQCLYNGNASVFQKHIDASRFIVFKDLNHSSFESVRSILPMMSCLQMLVLAEDYSNLGIGNMEHFHTKWNEQKKLPYSDFEFHDPILWLHCILLKQKLDCNLEQQTAKRFLTSLEEYAACAREENYLEAASRALRLLRSSSYGNEEDRMRWQIEEAKILWTKKDHSIANTILKSTLCNLEKGVKRDSCNDESLLIYAEALSLMGKFLEETCSDSSSTIMENYLQKTVDILREVESLDQKQHKLWDAHLSIARFADNQYQSIVKYKSSSSYQTKQNLMDDAVKSIAEMKLKKSKTMDEQRALIIRERQHNIDVAELEELDKVQQDYLMRAVNNYLICFEGTYLHDLWIFRLTALWFQNLKNDAVNNAMKNSVPKVETYKYLPIIYQLAARMGSQSSPQFAEILFELLKKIALDHPHHTLPVIFSLTNSDPSEASTSSDKKGMSKKQPAEDQERTVAAKKLLNDLQRTKLGPLLKDMSSLCAAYISLAYLSVKEVIAAKQKVANIPSSHPIVKIRNLHRVPVTTETVKVDRSCTYDNIIAMHSFEPSYRLCGGINCPKVIKCLGLDGVKREQLVKGRDDLRQDAVMQQVFSLVNNLLKQNKETRKRKLHIRTYKVVPLSQRSGVIQWCKGTQPFAQYLVGPDPKGGAHLKYYPNCWKHIDCQKAMKSIADYSSLWKKRQIFDEICQNFPPVFRYFFFENFPEPSAWFERRQSYIKSVATSSIVGYILGLGDRHVNNILVDKNTAEFVHIDFGIAFEKGRILQTPETVPFRLTRDVVDGMGFSGVDGVFKRCCEKTMEVMRNSQEVLLTILEVLLHDPLYDWKSTPSKSSPLSSSASSRSEARTCTDLVEGVNRLAERALMRLQQKLQGLEEGMTLSISGHVNLLIQQARDPDNLCKLYAGWQPYL